MRKPQRTFTKTFTAAEARHAATMNTRHAVKFTESLNLERESANGRNYRGQCADHERYANERFGGIAARASYQRRRGR